MKRFYRKDAQYFEENEKIVRLTKYFIHLCSRLQSTYCWMKSQPNRTRRRLNRRLTAVDAGLGTRDKVLVIFKLVCDWVGVVSDCTTGLFLGNEFWPSFVCNFVTTNKSSDSVTETIPQCNSTSHRPTLMVDLKMARFGQCPLFHLPVFQILVKGLGTFWFFGGPFCVSSSGPFRALGPFW